MEIPIRICVKIRPLSSEFSAVTLKTSDRLQPTLVVGENEEEYTFDQILGPRATNSDLYYLCGEPAVEDLFQGRNGCIFAYGLTGSGKTHSMLGENGANHETSRLDGLIPKIATELFQRIASEEDMLLSPSVLNGFHVTASYVEIYEGNVYDLLRESGTVALKIRANSRSSMVEGAILEHVKTTKGLVDLIARGSRKRCTKKTGMNEHSSRSHAILTLRLEKRWREMAENESSPCYNSQISQLMLIDLAGSENSNEALFGHKNRAGCHVNLGLLALKNVALALYNDTQLHIPYRDAALTRLLEQALSGFSTTWMVACIHSDLARIADTKRTLKFGTLLGGIKTTRLREPISRAKVHNPMENDVEDTEMSRRTCFISTRTFGKVHSRCAGNATDPLILFVHGSGSKNSSLQWNWLVQDILLSSDTPFYCVAVDCPGYGKTVGDRQSIRSYPRQFLTDIVRSLGKSQAHTIIGSSQGSASTFNAVLEEPDICIFIAVIHPLGHDVKRYSKIKQPTLLIFDTQDSGHPVSVGRQMKKHLHRPYYFEYDGNRDKQDWDFQLNARVTRELLKMFCDNKHLIKKSNDGQNSLHWPDRTKLAGGLKSWSHPTCKEITDYALYFGSPFKMCHQLDPKCNKNEEFCNEESSSWQSDTLSEWQQKVGMLELIDKQRQCLFEDKQTPFRGNVDILEENQKRRRAEEQIVALRQKELEERTCSLCREELDVPIRVKVCRHILCNFCAMKCIRFHRHCPVCGVSTMATDWKHVDLDLKATLCTKVRKCFAATPMFILEIGNTAQKIGNKWLQIVWLRPISVKKERGKTSKLCISKVEFNINPSFSKPTKTLKAPNTKNGSFTLEQTLGFEFPCFATVMFAENLHIPSIKITYRTQISRNRRQMRVAVVAHPGCKGKSTKSWKFKSPLVYDAEQGDGWCFFASTKNDSFFSFNSDSSQEGLPYSSIDIT